MHFLRFLLLMAAILGCRPSAQAESIPAPAVLPDDAAFLVVCVPDLMAALERLEQVGIAINPEMPKGMMKMGLSQALDDPEMKNLGKGPVAIIIAPGVPMPIISLVIPAIQPQTYLDALTKNGSMGKIVGNNVVVSQLPDGIDLGELLCLQMTALSSVPVQGDLRVLVRLDRVVTAYGPFLAQMAMSLGAAGGNQPGQQHAAKLMPLYAALLQLVGAEMETMQCDLSLNPKAIVATVTTAAKAGSPLAKALVAPAAGVFAAEKRLGATTEAVRVAGQINHAAMCAYTKQLLETLQKRPEAKDLITDQVLALIDRARAGYTGDWAMSLGKGNNKEGPAYVVRQALCVADGTAALDLQFGMLTHMFSEKTVLGKMYNDLGLSLKIARDQRSIGAAKVQKITMIMDDAKMPPGVAAVWKRAMLDTEFTVTNGFMLISQGAPIDGLVSATGKPAPLKARSDFGPGKALYADINLANLVQIFFQFMPFPTPGMDEALQKLPLADPVTTATSLAGGRVRTEWSLPTKSIAELQRAISENFRTQHQQRRQNQQNEEEKEEVDQSAKDGAAVF